MKEFKPIVEEIRLGPMAMRHRLPPKGGLATVVEARDGYKTYEPHNPPKVGDLIAAGGYKRLYRVDISPYSVALNVDLPSRGDAWQFHANAMLTVSVADPATVVRLRMADASVVESLIMRELRKRSRAFDISDIEQAEEALNDYLQDQQFPEVGFKIKYGWISLGVDESEVKYRQQAGQLLRDKDRAAGRAELERQQAEFAAERNQYEAEHRQMLDRLHAEHETELERIQSESRLELERAREAHRRELEKQRIAVYQDAINMDIPDLLVLRLATYPEDADTVIRILEAQERTKLDIHLQFFREMLAREEVVHAWQLEEPVLKMLQRLVEVFTLSNERAAIRQRSDPPVAVERGVAGGGAAVMDAVAREATGMDAKEVDAQPAAKEGDAHAAAKEGDAQPAASDAAASPHHDGNAGPTD